MSINKTYFVFVRKSTSKICLSTQHVIVETMISFDFFIHSGSPPQLTTLGRTMSLFPLDPRFTKVILASVEHQCLEEALTVVSLLSGESVFTDPPAKRQQAYVARSRYLSSRFSFRNLLFLWVYRIIIYRFFPLLHNLLTFYKYLRRENPLKGCEGGFFTLRDANM